jgi:hypothetical protein
MLSVTLTPSQLKLPRKEEEKVGNPTTSIFQTDNEEAPRKEDASLFTNPPFEHIERTLHTVLGKA